MFFAFFVLTVVLSVFRLYIILPGSRKRSSHVVRTPRTYTIAVYLGSGGHTSEAVTLMSSLDPNKCNRRIYVINDGDDLSLRKALELETKVAKQEKSSYSILSIPRARRVHQSLITTPLAALYSLMVCSYHLTLLPLFSHGHRTFADILILNGPGTCFILCIAVYINKFFGFHAPYIVFVETFARVNSLSLSGKLVRPFADRFVTQWPDIQAVQERSKHWLV
ncbi:glycosyltransferase family 1 protein [Hebeloma cylindrosporum]|uniref:UDP-N-acetylglucosamine transferase subunit ALG14 n=1 Tax=Hebeloma cylindrosporum TaxID=76867 RepID=A0A0C3C917_HEBCY|nr:glycosyltransferase family 1 protein [Hebeloma cylindrosporum h7]